MEDVEDEWFDSIDKYGINHPTDISRSLNYDSREVSYKEIAGITEKNN